MTSLLASKCCARGRASSAPEEALHDSEQKFRTLTECSPTFIGIIRGAHFIYANPYLVQASGYTQEELLTMEFSTLLHPDFREMVWQRAMRRLAGGAEPTRYELKILAKSGEERWVDLNVMATMLEGERVIIGTGIDITDRKQAEEALERERALLATAIQVLPIALLFVSPTRELLRANSAAYTFFRDPGYSTVAAGAVAHAQPPPRAPGTMAHLSRTVSAGDAHRYRRHHAISRWPGSARAAPGGAGHCRRRTGCRRGGHSGYHATQGSRPRQRSVSDDPDP